MPERGQKDTKTTNTNDTEIKRMTGIPNVQVSEMVNDLMADPRYISHKVIEEGNGKSTIEVTFRKTS